MLEINSYMLIINQNVNQISGIINTINFYTIKLNTHIYIEYFVL